MHIMGRKTGSLIVISIAVMAVSPFLAEAATLRLAPASGTFVVGGTFDVSILLNTEKEFINAIRAHISFPPDKLQVVSPSTGQSIVGVWTNIPNYDNKTGKVLLEGGIPKGINTEAGIISTITFRTKQVGPVAVKFLNDSQIILSDGKGTQVLSNVQNAVFNFVLPPPRGPDVSSDTHPDQSQWYSNSNVVLRWANALPVEGYSFNLSDNPADPPDDISDGSITATRYSNIASGNHYFHIKAYGMGVWGGVTDFAINVDTDPPAKFDIKISPSSYTTSKNPVLNYISTDAYSGLDHYEYKIVPVSGIKEANAAPQEFFIEAQPPSSLDLEYGIYDVLIRAYDTAGNFREEAVRLKIVTPLIYAITSPFTLILMLVFLLAAIYGAWYARKKHLFIFARMQGGINPEIRRRLEELERYRSKYGKMLAILLLLSGIFFSQQEARAQEIELSPPFVTTVSKNISNNEIFYLGGKTDSSNINVVIYLQNLKIGTTLSKTVTSDKKGDWFYRHDSFLESGGYLLWTQAKLGELMSPPSPQIRMAVAPTAIQFGASRISYETLYIGFIGLLAAGIIALGLFTTWHLREERRRRLAYFKELREAKEAIKQGFATLKKDVEAELRMVRAAKFNNKLREEEKIKEEQLLKDLAAIEEHINAEVGDIESLGYS